MIPKIVYARGPRQGATKMERSTIELGLHLALSARRTMTRGKASGSTRERLGDVANGVCLLDIQCTGVNTGHKNEQGHEGDEAVKTGHTNVLPRVRRCVLAQKDEPEDGWHEEDEEGEEDSGNQAEKSREDRYDLGNDPSDDGADEDQENPRDIATYSRHEFMRCAPVQLVVEESAGGCRVDTSADEDDRECDTKGNLGDGIRQSEECRRLDVGTTEDVDGGSGDSVDEDLGSDE